MPLFRFLVPRSSYVIVASVVSDAEYLVIVFDHFASSVDFANLRRSSYGLDAVSLTASGRFRPSVANHSTRQSPPDDQRHEGNRPALQAILADHPTPRCAAAQLLEGGGCWRVLHAGENDDIRAR